jgi:hypothetical protein
LDRKIQENRDALNNVPAATKLREHAVDQLDCEMKEARAAREDSPPASSQ